MKTKKEIRGDARGNNCCCKGEHPSLMVHTKESCYSETPKSLNTQQRKEGSGGGVEKPSNFRNYNYYAPQIKSLFLNTFKEKAVSKDILIEKCIDIRRNTVFNGSYAAPREAFREVITSAHALGRKEGEEKGIHIKGEGACGAHSCEMCKENGRKEMAEEVCEKIKTLKCDERKVSVFGKGMDSWEARTYDEKSLVNSVLSKLRQFIQEKLKGVC